MPKIRIREQEIVLPNTPTPAHVVFVPLKVSVAKDFKLYELREAFESDYSTDSANDKAGYALVRALLDDGFEVLTLGVTSLSDIYEDTAEGKAIRDALSDKGLYDILFLTAGAINPYDEGGDTTARIGKALIDIAKRRGDAIALISSGFNAESSEDSMDAEYMNAGYVRAIFDGLAGVLAADDSATYGAGFAPWGAYAMGKGSDEVVPAHAAYLRAFAATVNKGIPAWYPIAGSERGVIPGKFLPLTTYGSAATDLLGARTEELDGGRFDAESSTTYEDNEGTAINTISLIRPFGNILWGNRTLKKNDGSTTALSFLNVRVLVSLLKKELFAVARKFTFEPNTEVLWTKFTLALSPILDRMVSGNGIEGYKIQRETTNKKARLKARIRIIPIEGLEDFDLTVTLEDDVLSVD